MLQAGTILIVDDEPRTRQGLKKMLDAWAGGKYEVEIAADGDEALALLANKPVNVLISDIRMPEMTGLQMIRAAKEQGGLPAVILLSGYSEFDYAQEAIRLGVVNYLLKPVAKAKLIEAVEQALAIDEERRRVDRLDRVVDNRLADMRQEDHLIPQPIKEAMRYIELHLREPIGLREVAEQVHLNPSYFSSLFKEKTNLTFSEYVTRSRVQRAKHLLLNTAMPVSAIAEEAGYQTVKYFTTLFKEYEGMTPSQFRKLMSPDGTI
ncbi:response regulator [Paenibacillus athensensis]|uniref:DNA-binding response regulator n=1 Tax=Paenibacillus athensensis TaxID=1967502 RepID=A0A4Y8Q8X0_9BACL|nr:response regulator [Paenibacillus athensensis]MCD1260124.1 response regulator [Paenibacillus athensensis]